MNDGKTLNEAVDMDNTVKFEVNAIPEGMLGSLRVYSLHSAADLTVASPVTEYYWKDAHSPQGNGPFLSIYAAMDNYRTMQKAINQLPLPPKPTPGKVLRVDFQTRKRVQIGEN